MSAAKCPLAVVLVEDEQTALGTQSTVDAVNELASTYGVTIGQRVLQSVNRCQTLEVLQLPRQRVIRKLQQLARVALQLGPTVSFEFPDTVWVDVTTSSHLWGGEQAACLALAGLLRRHGHQCRVAVSEGPWSAQACARYLPGRGALSVESSGAETSPAGSGCLSGAVPLTQEFDLEKRSVSWPMTVESVQLLDPNRMEQELGRLPICALPLSESTVAWFRRMGLHCLGDLRKLPQAELLARLKGDVVKTKAPLTNRYRLLFDQIQGRDVSQLRAYLPEPAPEQSAQWEEPIRTVAQLTIQLSQLLRQLSEQLQSRGQATRSLVLVLQYDKAIARHRQCAFESTLQCSLPVPLQSAGDMESIVAIRLERYPLSAPVAAVRLQAEALAIAPQWQLTLNHRSLDPSTGWREGATLDPKAFDILFAQLAADLGKERVGRLVAEPAPLLENRTVFHSIISRGAQADSALGYAKATGQILGHLTPTRWLNPPVPVAVNLQAKAFFVWGPRRYCMEKIQFVQRLENVQWWLGEPIHRDYYWIWLKALDGDAGLSLLAFVDRSESAQAAMRVGEGARSKRSTVFIQALFD